MAFEGTERMPAKVVRSERTPLGPEVEINDNGKIFTLRLLKGQPVIVAARQGIPDYDKLHPNTIRTIEKAFEELREQA